MRRDLRKSSSLGFWGRRGGAKAGEFGPKAPASQRTRSTRGRPKFGGMSVFEAQLLKALERTRTGGLKSLLAHAMLGQGRFKRAALKKMVRPVRAPEHRSSSDGVRDQRAASCSILQADRQDGALSVPVDRRRRKTARAPACVGHERLRAASAGERALGQEPQSIDFTARRSGRCANAAHGGGPSARARRS